MIITIIVAILLAAVISATIWVSITTKNIPDVQKNTVKKLKQKLSRNECFRAYQNRINFIQANNLGNKEDLLGEVSHIINSMKKNNNYDIFMAYSRLDEIDEKIKLAFTIKQGI